MSIGFRGEALNSLCKSSKVVITTKHADEPTGLRVSFSTTGEIMSLEPVEMASPGTLVEVREPFMNNESYQRKFRQNIKMQFDNCLRILTSYSLIMANTVFHVTNGQTSSIDIGQTGGDPYTSKDDCFATEDLATVFTTTAPGNWYKNVKTILSRCFKRALPRMTEWLIEFQYEMHGGALCFDFICTKPCRGRKAVLAPRCF